MILNEIQNPFIREYLCYRQATLSLKLIKDTAKLLQAYNDFNKVITAPYYKGQIKKMYDSYKFLNTPGLPSPVFNYPDINSKMVSLKSLRGKYDYIDIWAT
ncbi:MAG: TlpA family protein disulfide reductase [Pseudobacter sp.]|uniref:TlpA family protein disulfide reductase n=1 Tax=Pseudobacter sp. TaxID=2045420 RepID=UPI003F7E0461